MKKILIGLFLLPLIFANAQENKNKFVVNGNLDISYGGNNGIGLGGFNIGYFLTDHFAIGITGGVGNNINNNSSELSLSNREENKQKRSENCAGVFARYNFTPKNKFSFFLNLDNSLTWHKYKNEYVYESYGNKSISTTTNQTKGYTISLNPGIIYFFHPKFSAEITLGSISYKIQKSTNTSSSPGNPTISSISTYNGGGARFFTTGINIGFSYYFGCKSKGQE